MNTWQDMSTAPKDGTAILIGSWTDWGRFSQTDWHWDSCVVKWIVDDWQLTQSGSYAEDNYPDIIPTHWCEIPQPPKP